MSYLTNIGLEVHVQLRTRSKMFCGCAVAFGAPPNSLTCPTCLGLPGALPTINQEALRLTTLTGLMLECAVAPVSKFDRKNYFYPDLAKNYQISQYDQPLCAQGRVPLPESAYPKGIAPLRPGTAIRLVRIHLEEDVAKSFHFEQTTGIDFNRAGTPLMEIVTEPEIESPEEAFAFLTALREILVRGGVSNADMEKGQLRCDCNVSIRSEEQRELGAKIEIKNMNSISGVRRALAFEVERQTAALERGESLRQETRGWDDDAGRTFVMRRKEMAHDYRYFPEPDLLPVVTADFLEAARVPELPQALRTRLEKDYDVSAYDAGVLASDLALARYFEDTVQENPRRAKAAANWILNDLQSALDQASLTMADCPIPPAALNDLLGLLERGAISGKQAKEVFAEMFASGRPATAIVQERGLEQLSDVAALEALCAQVIASNPKPTADFRAGHQASLNFLKGQVMKLSQGRANPALVGEILERQLSS